MKLLVDSFGHLDAIGQSVGFHACRGVHGVPPDIVEQLALAEHASDCRTGVNADPHGHLLTDLAAQTANRFQHVERHIRRRCHLVRLTFGRPAATM